MKHSGFTPGPWNVAKSDLNDHFSIYAWGPLAYAAGESDYAAPNARLMADAPRLLAVLREIAALDHERGCMNDTGRNDCGCARSIAAAALEG